MYGLRNVLFFQNVSQLYLAGETFNLRQISNDAGFELTELFAQNLVPIFPTETLFIFIYKANIDGYECVLSFNVYDLTSSSFLLYAEYYYNFGPNRIKFSLGYTYNSKIYIWFLYKEPPDSSDTYVNFQIFRIELYPTIGASLQALGLTTFYSTISYIRTNQIRVESCAFSLSAAKMICSVKSPFLAHLLFYNYPSYSKD